MPVRIDDAGFVRKLAAILQARGGRNYPIDAISAAVLAITIPGDQVLEGVGSAGAATVKVVTIPAPAAGAEIVLKPPSGKAWELVSLVAHFVASATITSRYPRLIVQSPAGGVSIALVNWNVVAITASNAWDICWARGVNSGVGTAVNEANRDLPYGFAIPDGGQLLSVTANIQPGDQWSSIAALVIERPGA